MCQQFEFQALLLTIADRITARELERMRFLSEEFEELPSQESLERPLTEVLSFFEELKTKNKLGIDKLYLLGKMLKHLNRDDLLLKVAWFQFQRQAYLNSLNVGESEIESGNQAAGSQQEESQEDKQRRRSELEDRGEQQAVANQTSPGTIAMKCLHLLAGAAWAAASVCILNDYKGDPQALATLTKEVVLPIGNFIKEISPGCINFLLQATDLNGLKELWKRYQSGQLKEDLKKVLVTEELKNLANGEEIDLMVKISEQEYRNACLDLMVARTKVHTFCQEITSPKLARRMSCSFPDLTSLDTTQNLSTSVFTLLSQLSNHLKKLKDNVSKVEKTENVSTQSQHMKETTTEFEDKAAMDAQEPRSTLTRGMATPKYTDENLNYLRLCYVITCYVRDGLRTFFKQQWNRRYQSTHGQWLDVPQNATDFYNMESPRKQRHNARLLTIMADGNTNVWDCTSLFHAILYSDCLGPSLDPALKKYFDDLREIRANMFSHNPDGRLTDVEFDDAMQKIVDAFKALGLDTVEVEAIKTQKSFLTNELFSIQQQLNIENKRYVKFNSFCVLPPKLSHDTIYRADVLMTIIREMEKLRSTKENETTVIYLSGNPGCGKSEIARQIGNEYFNKIPEEAAQLKFVFTFNASSIDTLLQSYVDFALRLGCDEDAVTRITTSKDLGQEDKIKQLTSLVNPKMQMYSSWLIIVDNVNDLRAVSKFLPQAGEKTSGDGQILVTSQDSQAIPLDSYTYHYPCLKEGMKEDDAIALLVQISGVKGDRETLLNIASALDFQPLALACAAVYMQQKFHYAGAYEATWEKYLLKLQEGKREATSEEAFKNTSTWNTSTITAAVKLALERVVREDKIMMHAFRFFSDIADEPMPVKDVVQYVVNSMPDKAQDLVAAHISSNFLVISSEDGEEKVVRVHQVVYHCLQKLRIEKLIF